MIFEEKFLEKIEKAIMQKDESFFLKYLQPKKREVRDCSFSSALMISAHKAKHLNKLDEIEVDAAILNLEDGVAKEYKKMALLVAALFIQEAPIDVPLLIVRVNPLKEGGAEEIEFLNDFLPDAIRVAKIEDKGDAKRAKELVLDPINIHFSIETKEAFKNITNLKIDERVKAFYLGILDLLADLDIPQSILKVAHPTTEYLLTRFLIESKIAQVLPVSFVYQDYQNLEEFEEWCRYEFDMGYRAKVSLSPSQVKIVNRIFQTKDWEIKRAHYIKKKFEEMRSKGITGFVDEKYGFIDEPLYKDALNILKREK